MPEHSQMVRLRKATGGSSLVWEGAKYSWGADGEVTEVPYALALSLLADPSWGYSVEGDPERKVTSENIVALGLTQTAKDAGLEGSGEGEGSTKGSKQHPAPEDDEDREVTEPAPKGKVAEAPDSGAGSPVTPHPRAGTRTRKA